MPPRRHAVGTIVPPFAPPGSVTCRATRFPGRLVCPGSPRQNGGYQQV